MRRGGGSPRMGTVECRNPIAASGGLPWARNMNLPIARNEIFKQRSPGQRSPASIMSPRRRRDLVPIDSPWLFVLPWAQHNEHSRGPCFAAELFSRGESFHSISEEHDPSNGENASIARAGQ